MTTDSEGLEVRRLRAGVSLTTTGGFTRVSGLPAPVLLEGMELPAKANYCFRNAEHARTISGSVPFTVRIYFGDHLSESEDVDLGQFVLDAIPPAPKGPSQIKMLLAVSRQEVLHVSVMDSVTNSYRCIGVIDLSAIQAPQGASGRSDHGERGSLGRTMDQVIANFLDPTPRKSGLRQRGGDVTTQLAITFEEALRETERTITAPTFRECEACGGARCVSLYVECTGWAWSGRGVAQECGSARADLGAGSGLGFG